MSSRIGRMLSVEIFGESHGRAVGVTLDGLPAGLRLDLQQLNRFVQRRAARGATSTGRHEADIPHVVSGLWENTTTGQPLTALFENGDTHSSDYGFLPDRPRPGHADYPALMRSAFHDDLRGSGHHSGRLTLPYVFAGGVALQLLEGQGMRVGAHVLSIGPERDIALDAMQPDWEALSQAGQRAIPTLDAQADERMRAVILEAKAAQNSLGGVVECVADGLPVGLGAPFFEGAESVLANYLFSIPAVKGVEFGAGFSAAAMHGSEYNDPYAMRDGRVATTRNNAGGLVGGMTTGMPILVRAAFRPTPSIGQTQQTVSLFEKRDAALEVHGRHDPCVVTRAVPVVESAVALGLCELWLERRATLPLSDRRERR